MSKRLLIVWHSRTGGAEQMACAAADGAQDAEPEVEVVLKPASAAGPEDVLNADAVLFAAPENLAAMSGVMKDFFDRSYYELLDRTNGMPYALLVCAGSDGTNAVRQIERIVTGLRLKRVTDALIVNTHAQSKEAILAPKTIPAGDLARCAEIGATLAAGVAAGIF